MSRYPGSPRPLVGLIMLTSAALSLLACAHAVDDNVPDSLDPTSDPSAGATSGAGSVDQGGGPSAGLGDAKGGGDLGGLAQGGGTDDGGAPGSAGQGASAGGSALAGSHAGGAANAAGAGGASTAGGASSAGRGGSSAGGSNPGVGGSVASGGSTGDHVCKITTDLNVYTPTNTGCGAYAACRGQIHWRNDEAQALSKMVLSFSEPAGTTCKTDNSASKWTITDNGATSHRCVFTASGTPWTVESRASTCPGAARRT